MSLAEQVRRRRTFAIISHPDAGKTTLTEKLLLFSGAIHIAGSVKARKASRHATSDWMEIEKQRGISVASSVMQMEYRDCVINLLDTPGHQDFSEDTYRVLTAVDAALMVIDAANGVEAQTLQPARGLPRAGHPDHHVRQQDGPRSARAARPARRDRAGARHDRRAVHVANRHGQELQRRLRHRSRTACGCSRPAPTSAGQAFETIEGLDNPADRRALRGRSTRWDGLRREGARGDRPRQLGVGDLRPGRRSSRPDRHRCSSARPSTISACRKCSTRSSTSHRSPLGRNMRSSAPCRRPRTSFAGVVFKIQANMDPSHRDRIAFVRVCSGHFLRGMNLKVTRSGQGDEAEQRRHVPVATPRDRGGRVRRRHHRHPESRHACNWATR